MYKMGDGITGIRIKMKHKIEEKKIIIEIPVTYFLKK